LFSLYFCSFPFLPTYQIPTPALHSFSSLYLSHPHRPSEHERKIELIRFLMAGYVNVHVLDTFSEHASVLASSAVATFQNEAGSLPPFLFPPAPSFQNERVPKQYG
jgi:hypothetical protein